MQHWRPTAALGRALILAALGLAGAVLLGDPVIVALVVPFAAHALVGLLHRPRSAPSVRYRLDETLLHEGQGTAWRCLVTGSAGAEHGTRVSGQTDHLALDPVHGLVTDSIVGVDQEQEIPGLMLGLSPRRWGRRLAPAQRLVLWSRWAGFRWESPTVIGDQVRALPVAAPYASRAEMPHPAGLVGAHRSTRSGSGTDFAGVRAFAAGDRLRRINWPVSLRTDRLHVVETRAEQDAGVLLVVDALADHGRSQGVDGAASALDVAVRAASAVAEQLVRQGDRVGLRVLGRRAVRVGAGTGTRHLVRVREALIGVVPGVPDERGRGGVTFHAPEGTIVLVFSPMLDELIVTAAASLMRSGLPVLVVDTLVPGVAAVAEDAVSARVAALAWRMRVAERSVMLDRLARAGCPVVLWQGPGTLDEVLRQVARRGRRPRVRA